MLLVSVTLRHIRVFSLAPLMSDYWQGCRLAIPPGAACGATPRTLVSRLVSALPNWLSFDRRDADILVINNKKRDCGQQP